MVKPRTLYRVISSRAETIVVKIAKGTTGMVFARFSSISFGIALCEVHKKRI